MLPSDGAESDHGAMGAARYTLKPDSHSSHSVLLQWLGEGGGRRLLDVGAASGLLAARLTAQGFRVTGIEEDPEAAAAARGRCERMIIADLNEGLPDLGEPFDAIVCGDVLEHLVDPARTLAELTKWVRPEGRIFISVPNVAHILIRLSLLVGRFDYFDRGILDRTHLRFFTERSLERLVDAAGLVIVRRTATAVPLYQVLPALWHGRLLAAVHAASAAVSRAMPRLFGYQLVVATERAR
jgi:2-polyprenyl-3-methyl-5-hydroxy-6-metoxy-1,4-benzoquinol methylase